VTPLRQRMLEELQRHNYDRRIRFVVTFTPSRSL
jgi:hypothetical protein